MSLRKSLSCCGRSIQSNLLGQIPTSRCESSSAFQGLREVSPWNAAELSRLDATVYKEDFIKINSVATFLPFLLYRALWFIPVKN
jgi:hypothetical protein